MKRTLVIVSLALLAVSAWAAVNFAMGRGAIAMREDSRGIFRFMVGKNSDEVRGALEFKQIRRGAERPLAVVVLRPVRGAEFGDHTARFGGMGVFNGHPVHVSVRVFDGGREHDAFALECKNREGAVVYAAAGELVEGGIEISSR